MGLRALPQCWLRGRSFRNWGECGRKGPELTTNGVSPTELVSDHRDRRESSRGEGVNRRQRKEMPGVKRDVLPALGSAPCSISQNCRSGLPSHPAAPTPHQRRRTWRERPRTCTSLSTGSSSASLVKLEVGTTDCSNPGCSQHEKFIPHFLSNTEAPFSEHPRNKQIFDLGPDVSCGDPGVLTVDFARPGYRSQTPVNDR